MGGVPPGSNVAVLQQSIDCTDFTTSKDIAWHFYRYAAASATANTRFDDITLHGGSTVGEDSMRQHYAWDFKHVSHESWVQIGSTMQKKGSKPYPDPTDKMPRP